MFDLLLRPLKDRVSDPVARLLGRYVSPNSVTFISLLFGLAAGMAILFGKPGIGLIFWLLNRVTDGLDGTIARVTGNSSDLGGYLDIMSDFLVYAVIPIAFAVHYTDPGLPTATMLLLAAFYINAGSWMYLSSLLEKRGREGDFERGRGSSREITSVTMPEGLIGGTETVLFFTLFFLMPRFLVFLFSLMAALTFISALQRVIRAFRQL